jgi:hypothetical protein
MWDVSELPSQRHAVPDDQLVGRFESGVGDRHIDQTGIAAIKERANLDGLSTTGSQPGHEIAETHTGADDISKEEHAPARDGNGWLFVHANPLDSSRGAEPSLANVIDFEPHTLRNQGRRYFAAKFHCAITGDEDEETLIACARGDLGRHFVDSRCDELFAQQGIENRVRRHSSFTDAVGVGEPVDIAPVEELNLHGWVNLSHLTEFAILPCDERLAHRCELDIEPVIGEIEIGREHFGGASIRSPRERKCGWFVGPTDTVERQNAGEVEFSGMSKPWIIFDLGKSPRQRQGSLEMRRVTGRRALNTSRRGYHVPFHCRIGHDSPVAREGPLRLMVQILADPHSPTNAIANCAREVMGSST